MGFVLKKQSGKPNMNFLDFVCDTADELEIIKKERDFIPAGSTAHVISEGKTYMINSNREWNVYTK